MDRRFQRAKPTNGWPYITEFIVFEILSWVPAHDLVRFKIVCKLWRSLIDDPGFVDLHKSRARRSVIGTVQYAHHILPPPNGGDIFLLSKRHGRILGSSTCGFVCVETGKNNYQVRNPATGKSLQLPPLKNNSYVMEMRVYPDPESGQLNVVAICTYSPTAPYRTFYWAVFTIGVDSEWTCWKLFRENKINGAIKWWTVVLCESAPICLIDYDHSYWIDYLRVDPHTKEVTITLAPFSLKSMFQRNKFIRAHEWDGKFAISSIDREIIRTVILDDDELDSWTCALVFALMKDDMSVCFVQQGKMWLKSRSRSRSRDLFSIDLVTGKIEKITSNAMQIYDFEPYMGTLETLEEMK